MPAHSPSRMFTSLVLLAAAAGTAPKALVAEDAINRTASPGLFGELVDIVTPGYLHWSRSSGDTVDPDADRGDLDDNFGEHRGAVDAPAFSSQAKTYGRGNVAEEAVYASPGSTVRWEFRVPGPGQYVIATRFWRELREPTSAVLSCRSGGTWVDLPPVGDIDHWGGYSRLSCFLIEVPQGQRTVPMRVQAASGRCMIRRVLLGRKREGEPLLADARPTHPGLHFAAGDVARLREKIRGGPPRLAFDYMVGQISWYTNTLDRGDKSWTPGQAEHHVPRSIAQTAFLHVLTEKPEYLDAVVKMLDTVMDWPVQADPIADQKAGYNILGRARILSAMAMAYDWLHKRLPARKLRRLRRHLDEEASRLYLYNETIVGCTESNNWDPWIAAGYGMAGLALRDEHPWARNWVASAARIFRLNLHRATEDFGYFNNGFVKALDFAVCLKTATGEDLFAPEAKRLQALLDYRMMLLEPMGRGYPEFGDAHGGNDPLLALCCAAYLRDPMAQWFVHHLSCRDADQVKGWGWNHMMPVAVVTLYDPALKEEAPGEPRLPLARSFSNDTDVPPGLRAVTILRTGYGKPTDVQLAFRCADYAGWHGHPDQGSFVLNALGDRLVSDRALGAPYGTPANDFSKSALAHSILLMDEKGQVPYSAPVFHDHEAGHTGPVLHTPFVDYVLADATVAYRKNPAIREMVRAHRHFLFVRRPDRQAYVVIVDDVCKDDKPHAYDWLLQTDTKHAVQTPGPNHRVINGEAELHVLTLEPKRLDAAVSDHHGSWRTLKLSNPQDARRGLFLHVLYPAAKGTPAPDVQRLEGQGCIAARVGTDDVFLFATDGKPMSARGIATDARIAAVGRAGGKPAWFLSVAGTRLAVDGQKLFEADRAVTAAFDTNRSGCVASDGPAALTLLLGTGGPAKMAVAAGTTTLGCLEED